MDKELMSLHHRNMLHVKPNLRSNISDQNLQSQMQIVYGILDVYDLPAYYIGWNLKIDCKNVVMKCFLIVDKKLKVTFYF